jgi:hypothetical protein
VDKPRPGPAGVEVAGLSVKLLREFKVASIRYFDAAGPLADRRELFGGPVPAPLEAVRYPIGQSQGNLILAWRSPTETILMTADGAAFAALNASMAELNTAGCMVEQTGGLWPWQVTGARTRDLLLRLGSAASIPSLGEARSSRVAELPVMALCVEIGKIILLVERVYSDHLLKWIGETAVDF